jgi:hypothetical protein
LAFINPQNNDFLLDEKVSDHSAFLCADYRTIVGNVPSSFSAENYAFNVEKYENV